jgi:hypothetical protein
LLQIATTDGHIDDAKVSVLVLFLFSVEKHDGHSRLFERKIPEPFGKRSTGNVDAACLHRRPDIGDRLVRCRCQPGIAGRSEKIVRKREGRENDEKREEAWRQGA